MGAVATFISASAVVGLLLPPAPEHVRWARHACLGLLALAACLGLASALLAAVGDWDTPVYTGAVAVGLLFPAHWLGRAASAGADGQDEEEDDEGGGGGGGGPPKDPADPPPAPSSPLLDWDAFDRAREGWSPRERELVEL